MRYANGCSKIEMCPQFKAVAEENGSSTESIFALLVVRTSGGNFSAGLQAAQHFLGLKTSFVPEFGYVKNIGLSFMESSTAIVHQAWRVAEVSPIDGERHVNFATSDLF